MKTLSMEQFGQIIKDCRVIQGLTQAQLAEIVDIDDKQLGKIERGVHYPSVPTFLKLIKTLNIDINSFYKTNKNKKNSENLRIITAINKLSSSERALLRKIIFAISGK